MATLKPSTPLFDIPPLLIENFCNIMDSSDGDLGWRGFASRVLPTWLDVRLAERLVPAGRSPTRELLWTWGLQNKTLGDLLHVLRDMGHRRATELFARPPPGANLHNEWQSLLPKTTSSFLQQERLQTPCEAKPRENPPVQEDPGFFPREENTFIVDYENDPVITYSDVLVGTQHFHPSCKIAEGPLSELYRGTKGGVVFAAKLFKQKSGDLWSKQWKEFKTELQVLQWYRHPNILELWGCFSQGDTYCLVRPYLANGSLFHRLHSRGAGEPLSCQTRLDVLKGTAKALHYLHSARPCAVLCGNISSANILLDDGLQAKLCDLGTAHLRPHSVTQSGIVTMATGSHAIQGYLPEEYIRGGKLSAKVDVYSLGVVTLEMLTGQKAVREGPAHTHLVERLHEALEDGGSVDACIGWLDPSAGCWARLGPRALFSLALECTALRAKSRPGMEEVLRMLCELQEGPRPLETPTPSLPVEDDEMQTPPRANPEPHPRECSQSEVTYLTSTSDRQAGVSETAMRACSWGWEVPDLYGSRPVHCSCAAEADRAQCEDCKANGFAPVQRDGTEGLPSTNDIVENPARVRLEGKILQYNRGLIDTLELLSMQPSFEGNDAVEQK